MTKSNRIFRKAAFWGDNDKTTIYSVPGTLPAADVVCQSDSGQSDHYILLVIRTVTDVLRGTK